jgi:hypothetical protein
MRTLAGILLAVLASPVAATSPAAVDRLPDTPHAAAASRFGATKPTDNPADPFKKALAEATDLNPADPFKKALAEVLADADLAVTYSVDPPGLTPMACACRRSPAG